MEAIQGFPIRRFDAGGPSAANDKVVTEARIELDINDGRHRLAMLCLPRELEALAVGFLRSEGVLKRREDLLSVQVHPAEAKVFVRGDFDAEALDSLSRRWTWGTGCGGGGTGRDLDAPTYAPVGPGTIITSQRLQELAAAFQAGESLWRETGGVHACALACPDGILLLAEDIGRHNAFDKIMGKALLEGIRVCDKFVLTTGRLSAEIVSKAVACRVPMLVSRSAVTSLAVKLSRRFGLTLVGFLRGGRLNVYTGYERLS